MRINITENITANITMEEVKAMIEEQVAKEGYDVIRVTPSYENKYSPDPRDRGLAAEKVFSGFTIDLKRKPQMNKRMM